MTKLSTRIHSEANHVYNTRVSTLMCEWSEDANTLEKKITELEAQLAEQIKLFDSNDSAKISSWCKRAVAAEAQLAKVRGELDRFTKDFDEPESNEDVCSHITDDGD